MPNPETRVAWKDGFAWGVAIGCISSEVVAVMAFFFFKWLWSK
jgi:hypothetical protein